ncbi:MAG: hypothetical protein ACI83Q_000872 [Colwellia polaris]|jgi:hypothetical protein
MALNDHARETSPETIEVNGEKYEHEALGAYKEVYRNNSADKVALLSSKGANLQEQAIHITGILHNENSQSNYGIPTATDYDFAAATVAGEKQPVAIGKYRDDLITHDELDDMLEDRDFQEKVYDEIFTPIRELAEEGMTTASPLDFINVDNRDKSKIIFDTRNFGYNHAEDQLEIIDNGELEPRGYNRTDRVPKADMSDYSFIEAEDFSFERPHDSVQEFIEEHRIDREAQRMLKEHLR